MCRHAAERWGGDAAAQPGHAPGSWQAAASSHLSWPDTCVRGAVHVLPQPAAVTGAQLLNLLQTQPFLQLWVICLLHAGVTVRPPCHYHCHSVVQGLDSRHACHQEDVLRLTAYGGTLCHGCQQQQNLQWSIDSHTSAHGSGLEQCQPYTSTDECCRAAYPRCCGGADPAGRQRPGSQHQLLVGCSGAQHQPHTLPQRPQVPPQRQAAQAAGGE